MAGWWSGGRLQGDPVAEGLELAYEVAGLAALVDAAGVVVGAQVVEAGGRAGEQVPDDHQDGAGDGDQRFELADAPDEAAVALAEEGVGLGGRGGSLPERGLEVGVALAGGAAAAGGAGLDGPGRQPGPRHQLPGVGNWPMSSPTSAMMTWAAWRPIPATSSKRSTTGRAAARTSPVWGSTRSAGLGTDRAGPMPSWTAAPGSPPGPRAGGVAVGMAVIVSSTLPVSWSIWPPRVSIWSSSIRATKAWWSENWPVRASTSAACLTRSRPRANSASTLGSRSPVISASSMARPETPKMSVATVESLIRASTRQPAPAAACAGSAPGSGPHAAGCSPAAGGSGRAGRTRAAACPARSTCTATPHPACRSWDGQAGARASRALTSHTTSPRACSRSTNGRQ